MVGLPQILVLTFCAASIFGLVLEAHGAQYPNDSGTKPYSGFDRNQPYQPQPAAAEPRTDPDEVTALSEIFEYWRIVPELSSVEPCKEAAYKSYITCDCSYDNYSSCHITSLYVFGQDINAEIPEALWNLTFLTDLNLGKTYMRGKLSPSIGNLKQIQNLNLGDNALSGELPKELGNLTDLRRLFLGPNNFTGSLPAELGNLMKLDLIYIDSCGFRGEIPSTFSNLKNLQFVWASDNELTGRIPEFIGNWSSLIFLRLEGNSFEGPIPSTFSNLTSMRHLMISDVSNGGSSLAFMKDMKSISVLYLRNNNISDSIPLNIGGYQNLRQLDLSFNSIKGKIPDSLFLMSSLTHLSLGNNKLDGTLPTRKNRSLIYIDLSYNYLLGDRPSWVNETNLRLAFPSGLNCLQRSFPCNRGSGIYSEFAIKCGGPQITSSTGIIYERDNDSLNETTYYVTNTRKWAVTNAGYFTGGTEVYTTLYQYNSSNNSEFTNTLDSKLFQTARLSPSSLRYYGLGLKNGNYNVTLQFAEIAFPSSATWRSLGRRVFDIYIQGDLVLKDFDIKREADGLSFRAVQKDFKVLVSENYLEIHLFWAGKGTCCIPEIGTYGPSISAISATPAPDFLLNVGKKPSGNKKNKIGLIVAIFVGAVGVLSFLFVFVVFFNTRRRKNLQTNDYDDLLGLDARPFTFSYAELKIATNDFIPANKLGEGGFGIVYKGTLNDGRVVAVKQLSAASHQGKNQFVTEIAIISAVQHRNLVKLYGCCVEANKRLLVYEYLENKSLDQALFGERSLNLNWSTRYAICLGVARGLAYLHEESRPRIVHRDVKASNILLDSDLIPKISDFGLAKLYDDNKSHISTGLAGTIGYLAPEYAMRGHLTEKTDVFAFGIVALEIVSGRLNSDSSLEEEKTYLLEWAWQLHENNCEVDLVDAKLSEFNEEEVKRVMGVSFLCTQTSPTLRPSMSRVVAMLLGDIEVSTVTSKPGYLTDWKFNETTSLRNDVAARGTVSIYYDHSESTSMVGFVDNLPASSSKTMLGKAIKEGR
ncbi:probable LRR receptor-like serine/threonine-protein kinase At1g56140 isoform X2 [Quercus lobata]|uniref:probable LRR receptor-like serine/threonine-protein kinase At1g56140 isoform X2 n=1 Tax=Quercus lobata TaxID=97700 RepID=UPI0012454C5C|nr:probable LRR receptor-like serine/threonine-protein kinase At1g56140 isoform X2 [Quercus lobata]